MDKWASTWQVLERGTSEKIVLSWNLAETRS